MKKTKIVTFTALLLSIGILSLSEKQAKANDSQNTQGSIILEQDTTLPGGGLYFDNIPNLEFGTQKISSTSQSYNLQNSGAHMKVVDVRGLGSGWSVGVKIAPFVDRTDGSKSLKGVDLDLNKKGALITESGNVSTPPTFASTTLPADNTETDIMVANANEGMGSWQTNFDNTSSTINVPSGQLVGDYASTITWILKDTP